MVRYISKILHVMVQITVMLLSNFHFQEYVAELLGFVFIPVGMIMRNRTMRNYANLWLQTNIRLDTQALSLLLLKALSINSLIKSNVVSPQNDLQLNI